MASRLAIIDCAPKGSFFIHGGRRYTASQLIAAKARRAGLVPSISSPAKDPGDFPQDESFDALIIPGSRLDIDPEGRRENPWMEGLIGLIRRAHEAGKPMLGICFGHQAIGVAFGSLLGRIPPPRSLELGMVGLVLSAEGRVDPLFEGVPERFGGMMWHYRFLEGLPEGAVALAKGKDGMLQSFRIGRTTWGVQFHPDYSSADVAQRVKAQEKDLREKTDLSEVRLGGVRHDRRALGNFLRIASGRGR